MSAPAPSLTDLCAASPALYTIPPTRPFLDDLAAYLLAQYKGAPAGLADVTIFLPTRRAARSLSEAFLRQAGPNPAATLLPQIRTLGDIGEDDLLLAGLNMPQADDIPPPLSPLQRRLVLARLVYHRQESEAPHGGPAASWTTALAAADELAKLLDSFYAEQVSFEKLETLVPERFADHWQQSLDFLKIITDFWPDHLQANGHLDPADHRRHLIDALSASWDAAQGGTPPANPVIIAGSTGSMPAVARLMRLVASLPNGCVILPGLDTVLDEAAWTGIEDPHPQAGLKHLLERNFPDIQHTEVRHWPAQGESETEDRHRLISLALRPAEATGDWLDRLNDFRQQADLSRALEGLSLIEAVDEEAEAQAIALCLRAALEVPDRSAILVTPDRPLARRVCARLARWGIDLDDSAGVPFANTPRGNFLRLAAAWLETPHDPQALLALLKHPLCRAGIETAPFMEAVSAIDAGLRGQPPGGSFAGLVTRLRNHAEWDALDRDEDGDAPIEASRDWAVIEPLAERLEHILAPFSTCAHRLEDRIACHLAAAEALCARPGVDGAELLWSRADGEAGADLLGRLVAELDGLPGTEGTSYTELFTALISGAPVRPQGQGHPRLKILGPLEARLQQADLVILGGLNEGIWPDDGGSDPFLSRPMRRDLGLPSPERQIGLAAHDFAQLASAPSVILTRAKRAGRAPAKPSRWIVRLKNVLIATDTLAEADITARIEAWGHVLDDAGLPQPARPPRPAPPAEARPDALYVTAIERLLRDPYSIYASHILGLRPLDPLSTDITYALRGRFYHHIFARFALDHPDHMPATPMESLNHYAEELFAKAGLDRSVRAFWQTRMEDSFRWFIAWHGERLKTGKAVLMEDRGAASIDIDGRALTLKARADRIDLREDGSAAIVDYKTGKVPTNKQDTTFSPQLALTGLIAERGGFEKLGAVRIGEYAFIKVLNRKGKGDDTIVSGDEARERIAEAEANLIDLMRHFSDPDTPYLSSPRPQFRRDYNDYDHLARRGEWSAMAGDEE